MMLILGSIFLIFYFFQSIMAVISVSVKVTFHVIQEDPKFVLNFFIFSLISSICNYLFTGVVSIEIGLSGVLGGIIYVIYLLIRKSE